MKISDSEMKIMNLIWEGGGPVTTAWLMERLADTGWKATTLLTFLSRLRAPTALAGEKDARVHLGHGHRQRPHRRAEHERDDGHVPYPLFQLVGGVVLITAGDA